MVPQLKRDVFAAMEEEPGPIWHETVIKTFENLPAEGPLLDYIVDLYVADYDPTADASDDGIE